VIVPNTEDVGHARVLPKREPGIVCNSASCPQSGVCLATMPTVARVPAVMRPTSAVIVAALSDLSQASTRPMRRRTRSAARHMLCFFPPACPVRACCIQGSVLPLLLGAIAF
jgi:hypothetical protein